MLTTPDYIARLTPDQRASLPVEWWRAIHMCPLCNRDHAGLDTPAGCPFIPPASDYRYIGPDITDPANLVALLVVCDVVGWCPCTIEWEAPNSHPFKCAIDYYDDEDRACR